MTTYFVVAHRAGARVLTHSRADGTFSLVHAFEHEEGRLMNREINADRPGQPRYGSGGSTYEPQEDAHTHVARRFAKEVATYLDRARAANEVDRIVLVAEPGFLGLLRDSLTKQTATLVRDTVHKDLHHVESRDLDRHLAAVL